MEQENAQDAQQSRLEQLNRYTRRTHSADEVFLFDVRLCDNEIDRDGERFSREALAQLKELFVGKTGIFDHNPTGENQTARIFETELVEEPARETEAGEPYTYVKGHAYMIRTDKNRDLIREIDGGIKKEVSISCMAVSQRCSVCGADRRQERCAHQNGHIYGGKRCHTILSDVTDAYEWSFVAVPAQREAGVTKRFGDGGAKQFQVLEKQLQEKNQLLRYVEDCVRKDIVRLRFLTGGDTVPDAMSDVIRRMTLEELLELQESLRTKQSRLCQAQLGDTQNRTAEQNTAFQLRS